MEILDLDRLIAANSEGAKRFFGRLLPFLNTNETVVVGGLAIRFYAAKAGIEYPEREFNDLDLLVSKVSDINPEISDVFLVKHYHRDAEGRFFVALVDPETGIKVDIFKHLFREEVKPVQLVGFEVGLTSMEDQLVKTVCDVQRVISGQDMVDPKQFNDARLLWRMADIEKADRTWRERNPGYALGLQEALEEAERVAIERPEYVQVNPFRKDKPYWCDECVRDGEFTITPMEEVFKVMGR